MGCIVLFLSNWFDSVFSKSVKIINKKKIIYVDLGQWNYMAGEGELHCTNQFEYYIEGTSTELTVIYFWIIFTFSHIFKHIVTFNAMNGILD